MGLQGEFVSNFIKEQMTAACRDSHARFNFRQHSDLPDTQTISNFQVKTLTGCKGTGYPQPKIVLNAKMGCCAATNEMLDRESACLEP